MQPHPLLAKVNITPSGLKNSQQEEFIANLSQQRSQYIAITDIADTSYLDMYINLLETSVKHSMYSVVSPLCCSQVSISYTLRLLSLYRRSFCWLSSFQVLENP